MGRLVTMASFSGLAEKQFEAPAQQHTASPAMPVTDQITATPTGQAEPCTRRSGQGGRRVNPIQATWTESPRGAPPCVGSSAGCRADKRAAGRPTDGNASMLWRGVTGGMGRGAEG